MFPLQDIKTSVRGSHSDRNQAGVRCINTDSSFCYGWPMTPGENESGKRRGDEGVKPEKRNRRVMREATRQDRVVLLQLLR